MNLRNASSSFVLYAGVFAVMGLSNVVVPILPEFADKMPALQGMIYSAYFFGAFLTVLPAGILSDRAGRKVLLQAGVFLTLISAVLLMTFDNPVVAAAVRLIEGIAAGLFVSSAVSWMNSRTEHTKLTGYYMAFMNAGLLSGLILTGFFAEIFDKRVSMLIFTAVLAVSAAVSLFMPRDTPSCSGISMRMTCREVVPILHKYIFLFISVIVLTGITGVILSLYPEYSGAGGFSVSILSAVMNIGTIIASAAAAHMKFKPSSAIRCSGAVSVLALASFCLFPADCMLSAAAAFFFTGFFFGFACIGQLNILAESGYQVGTTSGIYYLFSYGGMSLLPALAGIFAEYSYYSAFAVFAAVSVFVFITSSRCRNSS